MEVTKDIKYVGCDDHKIDLFEGQYTVPNGMSYNSYVILDKKIAVVDTVDEHFKDEWLFNLKKVLGDKKPSYLIVNHMESDHSANIDVFMKTYPEAIVVSSLIAFNMMKNFFFTDYSDRRLIVKEGDSLELGEHTLKFIATPMVHWPEVIMTYDIKDKVLFSSDAFGKFGANDVKDMDGWECEARRYYFGIVGKYGVQVQNVLKKAASLEISKICPLHGPVLDKNLSHYLNLYDIWSSYKAEDEGIFIAYASIYGHTKEACELLKKELEKKTKVRVVIADLARSDKHECIEDAFRYGKLVIASPTYNGDLFPCVKEFINALLERNYQNRTIGVIENGSWAPNVDKTIKTMFANSKDITFIEKSVKIMSAVSANNQKEIEELSALLV